MQVKSQTDTKIFLSLSEQEARQLMMILRETVEWTESSPIGMTAAAIYEGIQDTLECSIGDSKLEYDGNMGLFVEVLP